MASVGLYTLGCKVSQYETEAIAEAFEAAGYERRAFEDVCDVYVINTCTVTAESDRKSRQMIRRAIGKNPDAVVCVTGCYSQAAPEKVAAIPGVDIVIGTADKLSLVSRAGLLLEDKRAGKRATAVTDVSDLDGAIFEPMRITHAPRTRAYVKIEDGCECRCTYCAIPGARGPVRSKAPADVISEVEALHAAGTREIVLTGIEAASYGADFFDGYRLIDLLEDLEARHSAERIRFGSLTPELMKPDFVSRLGRLSIVTPHFHLSMQSGSDAVLRGMKRRYNREMALAALERVREVMPDVQFTTDLMVGFPGETEENFAETMDFVRRARFLDVHVFAYSPRPGTPAATYENQVPEAVKHERSARLIAEKNKVRDEILGEICRAGKPLSVVMETVVPGGMTGHSASFIETLVLTDRDLHGEIVMATPISHKDGVITAKM